MDDEETLLLVALLSLDDIEDVTNHRKGKARVDVPPTDEEIAFGLQAEWFKDVHQFCDDLRFARSIDNALDTDQRIVNVLRTQEEAANDDRAAAQAFHASQRLPGPTDAQRALERVVLGDNAIDESPRAVSPSSLALEPAPSFLVQRSESPFTGVSSVLNDCTVCGESIRYSIHITGGCNHPYCEECFLNLVEASLKDESLHPLRCCNLPFTRDDILEILPDGISQAFLKVSAEFTTPSNQRIYCPNPICSLFQGPVKSHGSDFACEGCFTMICPLCKQPSHPTETCTENSGALQVRELAQEQHWQTCPGCGIVVELAHGCYHMTCRCRQQFCYACAAPWKTCACPQWDEPRLLATAEQRVENEFGDRARQAPEVFRQRVRVQRENLRENHDCYTHDWKLRSGYGTCEECSNFLDRYLLRCRQCGLLACVRCSRNRL